MKQVFPAVRPRRLGTRGHSRYCYSGLRKKEELEPPVLVDLYCDSTGKIHNSTGAPPNRPGQPQRNGSADEPACALIREWAEKLLGVHFSSMSQLADFLVDKPYVDQRSRAAVQWNKLRNAAVSSVDGETPVTQDGKGAEQDHMRELKRKLQVNTI